MSKVIAVTKVMGFADPLLSWIRGSYWRQCAINQHQKCALVAASTTGPVASDDWLNGLRQVMLASVRHRADSD